MARPITEIKKGITDNFIANTVIQQIYGLNPVLSFEDQFSIVSFENVLFEIMAMVVWTLESIFDAHRAEVIELIAQQKVPSLNWYRNLALSFQYGFSFSALTRSFINGNATPDEIENSKVIKYCSVTRNIVQNRALISMKIATEVQGEIQPVSTATNNAFQAFIDIAQAAGDHLVIVNYLPDVLKLNFKVCYDPQILLPTGQSILTGKYPVKDTVSKFLKNLPFNGELSVQDLRQAIKTTEGVTELQELSVESKWIQPGTQGYGGYQPITISRIPRSGHFKIEDWSGIEYIIYQAQP